MSSAASLTENQSTGKQRREERDLAFNPDALAFFKRTDGSYTFLTIEYDNGTEADTPFKDKLTAYAIYRNRKRFTELIKRRYLTSHLLTLTPEQLQTLTFTVLTTTKTEARRNRLLRIATLIDTTDFLLFTSLPELETQNFFDQVWLSPHHYATIAQQERELHETARKKKSPIKQNALERWRTERIAPLPRISIL